MFSMLKYDALHLSISSSDPKEITCVIYFLTLNFRIFDPEHYLDESTKS